MQREISISGHEMPIVNEASASFTTAYDFDTPLYPSAPKHSALLDYNNGTSSISLSWQSEEPSAYPRIQQKLLHQDLMDHHQSVLSHLRDVSQQALALRQENVNLKMANVDLNNRLTFMLNTAPYPGVDVGQGLDSVLDGIKKMGIVSEEGDPSEIEAVVKSPISVMDSGMGCRSGGERVHLPKSISVRSSGYLKASRASGSSGRRGDCTRPSNQNKFDNGTQRVYVKGMKKEQPLELEVYNQGMFKTELCNKWQQTGTCPYGANCQFAHGIEELRPVLRHPRYKTEVCRMVLSGIPCPYGHRCHFRHTLTDQEQLTRALIIPKTLHLPSNDHQ